MSNIIELNNISNKDQIFVGNKLKIPTKGTNPFIKSIGDRIGLGGRSGLEDAYGVGAGGSGGSGGSRGSGSGQGGQGATSGVSPSPTNVTAGNGGAGGGFGQAGSTGDVGRSDDNNGGPVDAGGTGGSGGAAGKAVNLNSNTLTWEDGCSNIQGAVS